MQLQQNIPLAPLTTLGVGGPARWLVNASTEAEIEEALAFARAQHLPVFVLGGGSNLLVSDKGFAGLVLQVALQGIVQSAPSDGRVLLRVAAGESWDRLVQHTVERNLAGMECLAGIPGTVGGTPVQNVGAYGQEVSDTIRAVHCIGIDSGERRTLSATDCGFAYRTSLLNTTHRGRLLVTGVDFELVQGGAPRLAYADLRRRFAANTQPTLQEVAEAVRNIRREKGMVVDPADPNSRSAGSFFRNPVVDAARVPLVSDAAGVPEDQVPNWPAGEGCVKLPAAWLLEQAGFVRGYQLGRAGISARHTLALVNRGGATAQDIVHLRDRIISTVQRQFGILLEQEPVGLGDFNS